MEPSLTNLLDFDFYPKTTSEEELKKGCSLTYEQIQWIKFLQTKVAQDLVTLEIDPLNLHRSLQIQAALRGKLDAYRELLSAHASATLAA